MTIFEKYMDEVKSRPLLFVVELTNGYRFVFDRTVDNDLNLMQDVNEKARTLIKSCRAGHIGWAKELKALNNIRELFLAVQFSVRHKGFEVVEETESGEVVKFVPEKWDEERFFRFAMSDPQAYSTLRELLNKVIGVDAVEKPVSAALSVEEQEYVAEKKENSTTTP
jgi:hypothetical protein